MNGLGNVHQTSGNSTSEEESGGFRRKLQSIEKWRLPRRYLIALLLFLLLFIKKWRNTNVVFILTKIVFLNLDRENHPALGNWTVHDLDSYTMSSFVIELLAQIPAGILIFKFGSHKYFYISASVCSVLHMLVPTTLQHHSVSLLFILIGQALFDAPVFIAMFSTWKDWAPPSERIKLVVFSMLGIYVEYASSTFSTGIFPFVTSYESFYYAGVAGIVWALFWYNITSDTPQNDPLIFDKELLYLENNIPSENYERIELKEVPWKSIVSSKQVMILGVIFLKTGFSAQTIRIASVLFLLHLNTYSHLSFFIPFLSSFVLLIPCSAILADFLIKKYGGRALLIRKCFLCGGFVFQSIFMLGTLAPSETTKAVFYVISYIIYVLSLPGFITLPLDLAPRYAAITAGIAYTFFYIAPICFKYFAEASLHFLHLHTVSWLFLLDGILSVISAALFAKWGDVEEQLWPQNSSTRSNGGISYPKTDDPDNSRVVSSNA